MAWFECWVFFAIFAVNFYIGRKRTKLANKLDKKEKNVIISLI